MLPCSPKPLGDPQALGPHMSSLKSSIALSLGRPAFIVPSFVATFALPNPSLASFGTSASLASALPVVSSDSTSLLSAPILHQSFVTGPGISPIPAKLVSQIFSGKYEDLCDLLSPNLAYVEPEPQVLFDGRVDGFICRSKEN